MKTLLETIPVENLEKIADMLKAVAHPVRIQMLELLIANDELSVSDMHEAVGIEQSLASHHLSKMKDRGLLGRRRDGKNTLYYLKEKQVVTMLECMRNCKL